MSTDGGSSDDGDAPGGEGGAGAPGRRSRPAPNRVTLQFAGPKLTLPGEADEPLRLDTSEFRIGQPDAPVELDESDLVEGPDALGAPPDPALSLDLDGMEPDPAGEGAPEADGWTRMRDSEAPKRPRSVTPPPRRDAELDLVSKRSRPPSTPGLDLASEMADRYALGDFTGALRVAELLLGKSPDDVRAQKCAESSRERLIQLHSARLAALSSGDADAIGTKVPRVKVPEHEIRWLGLDHRQGFLLSRLDGRSSIEDLVDLGGMTRLEVLRTLVELIEAGAVVLAAPDLATRDQG